MTLENTESLPAQVTVCLASLQCRCFHLKYVSESPATAVWFSCIYYMEKIDKALVYECFICASEPRAGKARSIKCTARSPWNSVQRQPDPARPRPQPQGTCIQILGGCQQNGIVFESIAMISRSRMANPLVLTRSRVLERPSAHCAIFSAMMHWGRKNWSADEIWSSGQVIDLGCCMDDGEMVPRMVKYLSIDHLTRTSMKARPGEGIRYERQWCEIAATRGTFWPRISKHMMIITAWLMHIFAKRSACLCCPWY